jgi:acyl-CoA thioesterase-1
VFLGTSLTAGLGVADTSARWPERVGALADSAGMEIEVVNAGVSGDTSAGGLRRLDWLLSDPVDVLVVELGANDGLRGHSVAALEDNLEKIVDTTRRRWPGARVVVAGMEAPPNLGQEYTERFRAVFPRVAESTDAALVPFLLEGVAGIPELNQADGIHPTAAGHDRMARNAWSVLAPILTDLTRGSSTP